MRHSTKIHSFLKTKMKANIEQNTIQNKIEIKDLRSLLSISIKASKFVTVSPYQVINGRVTVCRTRLYIGYAVLILANLVSLILPVFQLPIKDIFSNSYILLGFVRRILYQLCIILVTIMMNFKQEKSMALLNAIILLNDELPIPKDRFKRLARIVTVHLTCIALGFLVYVVIDLVNGDITIWNVVRRLPMAIIVPYAEFIGAHFLWFVSFMDASKTTIQRRLENVWKVQDIMIVNFEDNHINYRKPTKLETKTTNIAEKIEYLRLTYDKLDDMKEEVNRYYSPHLLLSITSIFIEMVYFVFVIITIFQYWNVLDKSLPTLKLYQIGMWTLVQILKLFFMILISNLAMETSKKMGVVVHKTYQYVKDKSARDELTTFSIELLHRNPYITAAGFFNVDFTLLYAMIGAVTMYTIILIQFRFPEDKNGMNPVISLCTFI